MRLVPSLLPHALSLSALWSSATHGNPISTLYVDDDGQARILAGAADKVDPSEETDVVDACGFNPGRAPPKLEVDDIVDNSTLHGKIMAGYQGWFDTPCSDYKQARWRHWAHLGGPAPDEQAYQFEMWPDTREYDDDELCPTGFTYADGKSAGLFSSFNSKTVDRHVRWMYEYGISGVFFQRFITKATHERCFEDKVLDNIRKSSERYGRSFVNMYDVSGAKEDSVYDDIKKDWMYLIDVQEITKSTSYLHHKGRPLLSIWGFGVLNRPGEPAAVAELISWFVDNPIERYRVTLKGGVPNGWQTLGASSKKDPAWAAVYRMFDVISPWSVGRYDDEKGADKFCDRTTVPNAQECESLGIDYMPVVWPGFSWAYKSLMADPDLDEPLNKIPRNGGSFFWRQLSNSVDAFSTNVGKQVYVAMFDEVDEATAMMKVAENKDQVPVEGQFLALDADGIKMPSDWYLRLMGYATEMLRKDGSVSKRMPKPPSVPGPAPRPINVGDMQISRTGEKEEANPTTMPTVQPGAFQRNRGRTNGGEDFGNGATASPTSPVKIEYKHTGRSSEISNATRNMSRNCVVVMSLITLAYCSVFIGF